MISAKTDSGDMLREVTIQHAILYSINDRMATMTNAKIPTVTRIATICDSLDPPKQGIRNPNA